MNYSTVRLAKNLRKTKRPADWPKSGWYWFLHHDTMVEWTDDIDERWDYVCQEKGIDELPIRLAAIRPVVGELPPEVVKVGAARYKAWDARDKARDAFIKAWDALEKAGDAYDKALCDHAAEIDVLRLAECPDVPWDGESLIFKEGR